MGKRRAIIVVEFEMKKGLDYHQEYKTIAAVDDHMSNIAEQIRLDYTTKGLKVSTSVGAVCTTVPRNNERGITEKDLNKVTFRGIGTKHKKEKT
jgi:hypothetical protein|tara:strand:+ start:37 stop:318 length:282 start_codon:yes stop_codon:yes gene_type:complete